jgi:(p)ppGpp synthase/HD superfamily hydrolase
MQGENWSQDYYLKAYKFAAQAHLGQVVPGTAIPYLMHLTFVSIEVIGALRFEPGRDEDLAVQCALLHDVLEDTQTQYSDLSAQFGVQVAEGVLALTKDSRLPKEAQMQDSLRRIRLQPPEIAMVKLADRITNLQPPPAHWGAEKIQAYQLEAIDILSGLGSASRYLATRLGEKIRDYHTV